MVVKESLATVAAEGSVSAAACGSDRRGCPWLSGHGGEKVDGISGGGGRGVDADGGG